MLSPGHFQSSFGYKSHTSGRITFQGEGHERMCFRRDRKRDFLEMQGHGLAVARGQDETGTFSFGRTDGSENIGRRRPLVARRRGPGSAFRPSPSDLVFLPDSGFIFT